LALGNRTLREGNRNVVLEEFELDGVLRLPAERRGFALDHLRRIRFEEKNLHRCCRLLLRSGLVIATTEDQERERQRSQPLPATSLHRNYSLPRAAMCARGRA